MKKVLITGAYGLVGNVAYRWLTAAPDRYEVYGLVRRRAASARLPDADLRPIPDARLRVADLTDFAAVQKAVSGMDVVVHLAATPDPSGPWESIHANNVMGSYHVFEACRLAGVARVVYASTVMVIFGYDSEEPYRSLLAGRFEAVPLPDLRPIRPDQSTRPRELYAVSKVWGEGLAYMYARTHGLSCLALRIGWVLAADRVPARWGESVYCSQRDIAQIIERCVAAPASLRFGVFFGLSDNRYNLADISNARELLGYAPQDGYR
jgi:nucleoside-diphosphate-sugar epimerase